MKQQFRKVLRLPNGKRKWVAASSEQELAQKVAEIQMQANMGIDVTDSITFGEYALKWYRVSKAPRVGANSRAAILNVLNNHILPYLSGVPIRNITQMQVQYVFTMLNGKSSSLISKVSMVLKEIFNSAIANRIVLYSPVIAIQTAAAEKKEKRALSAAEENALLQELSKDKTFLGRRTYLFALLGFKTGLRRGELAALMLSDFDLQKRTLTVNRAAIWPNNQGAQISDSKTKTKTKAAHRTLPIPDTAYPTVKAAVQLALAEGSSLYLFHGAGGQMLSYSELRNLWRRVQKASPVTLSMHEMRHTYCTHILLISGLSIKEAQYFMGHSDSKMTMDVYNHFIEAEQREPASVKIRACI